jgi:hypothetical protein
MYFQIRTTSIPKNVPTLMSQFEMFNKIQWRYNAFARLNTGIVGSNPDRGMDVSLRLFCFCVVLCR